MAPRLSAAPSEPASTRQSGRTGDPRDSAVDRDRRVRHTARLVPRATTRTARLGSRATARTARRAATRLVHRAAAGTARDTLRVGRTPSGQHLHAGLDQVKPVEEAGNLSLRAHPHGHPLPAADL